MHPVQISPPSERGQVSDLSPKAGVRSVAVDAYRGFVMLLMMAEVLELTAVARAYEGNSFWQALAYHQTHVPWAGCSLHDTIQPGFSFLVGVALPFSVASRLAKGGRFSQMFGHALRRSFILVALGIFLRSVGGAQTYFTFEDTLTQIGLGYPFLFLLGFRHPRWHWIALGGILFGYWLAWALFPVGAPPDWAHNFPGFAAHWNKDANLGNAFDRWFLNLFPRVEPFLANRGGYLTLSFIPTLGTMILGLMAGCRLRTEAPRIPVRHFLVAGAVCLGAGLALHYTGICPIVKRIWTPSWTLFSGGLCFWFLAVFSWVMEVRGYRRWAFPLKVIGMNSIAAYVMAELLRPFFLDSLRIHLGLRAFQIFGTGLEPLLRGMAVLLIYWSILFWMYRRKVFLRI
jgi:heparan-alpha-glucosaminide N-acetyltransferase